MPPKEAFSKAKTAALRALEIDDTLAEAHTSLAHVHMHGYEWQSAGWEFRRAIELNPNYATAHHWHAYYLMMLGRVDEAWFRPVTHELSLLRGADLADAQGDVAGAAVAFVGAHPALFLGAAIRVDQVQDQFLAGVQVGRRMVVVRSGRPEG